MKKHIQTTGAMNITYKDNTISKIENVDEIEPNVLGPTHTLGNAFVTVFKDIEEFEFAYSKKSEDILQYTIAFAYDKIDKDALTEVLGDITSERPLFYNFKEKDLEKFKTTYLEDYMCN